jgi:tryptophan synthase alpha chain
MSRLDAAFARRPAFMPYFPLGYPAPETSADVIAALAKNGADLIEVGLPFSDPLADGPVIQRATQIALSNGMTTARALSAVAELRARGVSVPLVLMGYYNPLLAYGLLRIAAQAAEAGADGFIVPDLPPEESAEFESALAAEAIHESPLPLIRMIAPITPPNRVHAIAQGARGFIYLVSLTGVTGARTHLPEGLPELIARVREHTALPLCVGFGISSPEHARAVGQIADGVIVGSACVKTIGDSADPVKTAADFARAFKAALAESAPARA